MCDVCELWSDSWRPVSLMFNAKQYKMFDMDALSLPTVNTASKTSDASVKAIIAKLRKSKQRE